MSEKYLSEAEIQNIAKYLEVKGCKPDPTKVWGRKMLYAAIATAASDKAYAAAESERDALRAEVERYKRALEKAIGLGHYCPPGYTDCDDAGSDIKDCAQCRSEWALSEAGK
jgi:hypothetical protein